MIAAGELAVQIANTEAFIAANPSSVVLIPRTKHMTGTGTQFVDGSPRPPQTIRLIDQSTARNTWPGKVQTSDGVERLVDFILLGMPDVIVENDDYWKDSKGTLEVIQVYPSNQYEVRAAVIRRA
jgi:hypothetical protein